MIRFGFRLASVGVSVAGLLALCSPVNASTLAPYQLSGDFSVGYYNGYHQFAYNPLPGSSNYTSANGDSGHIVFDTSAPSTSVSATASGTNGTTTFISSSLTYEIEITGAAGLVPVNVQSVGERHGFGLADLAIYNLDDDNPLYQIQTDPSIPPFDASFNTNNVSVDFVANKVYTVQISTGLIGSGSEYVDPTFQINPAYAATYQLNLSPGIGAISPVPLPASAPMFGAALLALGAAGYGLKRRSRLVQV